MLSLYCFIVDVPVDPVHVVLHSGVDSGVAGGGTLVPEADHSHQAPPILVVHHQGAAGVALPARTATRHRDTLLVCSIAKDCIIETKVGFIFAFAPYLAISTREK